MRESSGLVEGQNPEVARLLEISAALLLTLQRKPEKACGGANRLIDQRICEVESQIASLGSLKRLLENLRDECGDSRPSKDCGILKILADPVNNASLRSAAASD